MWPMSLNVWGASQIDDALSQLRCGVATCLIYVLTTEIAKASEVLITLEEESYPSASQLQRWPRHASYTYHIINKHNTPSRAPPPRRGSDEFYVSVRGRYH